jgi:NAD(P)-dependent dehydrogenase (short-subunit alcohol dehydrogenase family)
MCPESKEKDVNIARLFDLSGKVALVTGASKGIGFMAASGLAAAGVTVYMVGRDGNALQDAVERIGGPACIPITADLTKDDAIEEILSAIEARGRGLDFLVNNAGASWGTSVASFPKDRFEQVVDLNLGVPFRLVQRALPLLTARARPDDPARIINIASIDGMEPPSFESYPYSASKAGVIMLTRHLAGSLAGEHITVNAISPGLFPSRMTSFLFKQNSAETLGRGIPLGRVGRDEDIAGALIYLLSRAGSWVTGVNLPVAGGLATVRGVVAE